MKKFTITFRDKATDTLYCGVVDQTELAAMISNTAIIICVVREIEDKE